MLLATGLTLGSPASAAPSGDKGCVTFKEYKRAKPGMTKRRVQRRIFHAKHVGAIDGGLAHYTLSYMSCDKQHAAIITYGLPLAGDGPARLAEKAWTGAS